MLSLILLLLWQARNLSDLSAVTSALRQNQFNTALRLTQALLNTDTQDPRIWTLQGFAHNGLNQKAEALTDFRKAVAIAPNYLPALKAEAQIEYAVHDQESLRTLERVAALEPNDAITHAMLGALAYQRQDCNSVVANYKVSESMINSQSAALAEYGQCLFAAGQQEKALGVLTRTVQLDPTSWQLRYNLAVADLSLNLPEQALTALQPLLHSSEPQVLDLASSALEAIGNTPQAVDILRKAIISDPARITLYLHFADLSFSHNSFQVGIDMLDAGLRKVPDSPRLYLARGILFVQLGDYSKAESDFAKAAQLDPSQAFSSVARGLSQLQQGNLDRALTITRSQLKENSQDSYLWYVEAETLRQKGVEPGTPEFKEAVAAVETALRLKPKFPLAQDLLGTFYLHQDQVALARQQFETVLQEEPENESALYHLIVASKKSGKTEAIPALMKRLAQAKSSNKDHDQRVSRYTFVEPSQTQ